MSEMEKKQFNQLDEALRALAADDLAREAAPRVEATLLQAFRQQHLEEKTAPLPVIAPARDSLFGQWRFSWGIALAGAFLLVVGFIWGSWRAAQPVPSKEKLVASQSPAPAPTESPSAVPEKEPPVMEKVETPVTQLVVHHKSPTHRNTTRATKANAPVVEEEIATEFFPLVSENALPERGQMRRVKVPRSTLIHFGLPIDAERTEIPINADLLIGEDGGARAIRFVQDRFPTGNFIQNNYGRPVSASYRNQR